MEKNIKILKEAKSWEKLKKGKKYWRILRKVEKTWGKFKENFLKKAERNRFNFKTLLSHKKFTSKPSSGTNISPFSYSFSFISQITEGKHKEMPTLQVKIQKKEMKYNNFDVKNIFIPFRMK